MSIPFSAAFLEKRMSEHKRRMHDLEHELLEEVMAEIAEVTQMRAFKKLTQAQNLPFPEVKKLSHGVRI